MFRIGVENQLACGLTMLVGSAFALGLGWYRCGRAKLAWRKTLLATVLLPLSSVFFAHLLYCLADVEAVVYNNSFGFLFAFWEKGHMLYGGMLGAALALAWVGGKDRGKLLEQFAPSGAWMILTERIAEGCLGQGYGEYGAENPFFMRFPFMVFDPDYEEWAWALFVLEALVALGLFLFLLKKKTPWQGDGALALAGLYASFQIVLESLRRDEFLRWGFVRVEEVVSAALVLTVLLWYGKKAGGGRSLEKGLCLALAIAMIVFCLLLEFATEERIPFLTFLDVTACYIAMAGACALLGVSVLWMRRLCNVRYTGKREECC